MAILALLGARRRSWWIALGVGVVLSLPFGLLWIDYAHALLDARNDFGIDYLFGELPLAAAPVIAWAGRTRPPRDRPA